MDRLDDEEVSRPRALSGASFLLGAWLVLSPFILAYSLSSARFNQVLFGLVVMALSAVRFFTPRLEITSWLNGLAGLWLIVAPFFLNYDRDIAYWNEVVAGIIVASLAFWSLDTYSHHHYHPV